MIVFHLYESAGYWAGRPIKYDIDVLLSDPFVKSCFLLPHVKVSSLIFLLPHVKGIRAKPKSSRLARETFCAGPGAPQDPARDVLMKRYAKAFGIPPKKAHVHSLRHVAASSWPERCEVKDPLAPRQHRRYDI